MPECITHAVHQDDVVPHDPIDALNVIVSLLSLLSFVHRLPNIYYVCGIQQLVQSRMMPGTHRACISILPGVSQQPPSVAHPTTYRTLRRMAANDPFRCLVKFPWEAPGEILGEFWEI